MPKRYALFTDLHIGVHQNSATWHEISLGWCNWFVEELRKEKITDIIFTGDFFHSRSEISVNSIQVASMFLDKLSEFSVIMIPGNHDCYYKDNSNVHSLSILKGHKNITIFDKVTKIKIGDYNAVFCPWGTNIEEIPECDIIFGHFEIETFKMNLHKVCESGIKPKSLLERAPLVFSGHFHLNDERDYDKGRIVYVGSPFQLDFGERENRKGFYILNVEDELEYTFVKNYISPVHRKVSIEELIDGTFDKEECCNNFIKIIVESKHDQKIIDEIIHKCNKFKPLSLVVEAQLNDNINVAAPSDYDLSGVDISKAIIEFINMLDIESKEKEEVTKQTLSLYSQVKV
jgi:DNA repair exonuclease SbcCD nuclease subunit